MSRVYISDLREHLGREVEIAGWVDVRRDHGKLIFIDLRDRSGKIQMVALPANLSAHELADKVRPEWVLQVRGKVNPRPTDMANKAEPNGEIELEILDINILAEAKTPPIDVRGDGREIGEEIRLKYRYLDLRRPRLIKNIRARHQICQFIRQYLSDRGFLEVETPILTKSTPEGARDYVVPSRLERGKFYALPQSPQQYKQLLMAAGVERYFQIARCMRDEDTRGDRQPEFTQLDVEMSFVEQEDVINQAENLLIAIVENLFPDRKIQEKPFPRLTYKKAMEKFGSDKPDLRRDKNNPDLLSFVWVIDFPFFEKTDEGGWTFTHNPFSMPKKDDLDKLLKLKNIGEILTAQFDVALNGFEIAGGSVRAHRPEILEKVFEIIGYSKESVKENFGHMLEAFSYGAPPHGGIAWGLDRLLAILLSEPNIREVIAFPKTGEGRDPMMGSPSKISQTQLEELGIELRKNLH